MRAVPVLASVGLLVVATACPARACLCKDDGPPLDQARSGAVAVFAGRVVSSRPTHWNSFGRAARGLSYRFEVDDVWKGDVGPTVAVVTGSGRGDCGYPFKVGRSYLVFAERELDGTRLSTWLCTRTNQVPSSGADLTALGQPTTTYEHVHWPWWYTVVPGVLGGMLGGALLSRLFRSVPRSWPANPALQPTPQSGRG
jgi:hypothetical protein